MAVSWAEAGPEGPQRGGPLVPAARPKERVRILFSEWREAVSDRSDVWFTLQKEKRLWEPGGSWERAVTQVTRF